MMNLLTMSGQPIGYILFGILGVVAWFLLIRAAVRADSVNHSLRESLKHQQAATWLLIKLCEKQGVTQPDIDEIKKTFGIK